MSAFHTYSNLKAFTAPSFTPASGRVLQRKCGSGGSSGLTGECEECTKSKLSLQRSTQNVEPHAQNTEGVPPIVHEVLRSPGQPLDAETRAFFEPRFGHYFGRISLSPHELAPGQALTVNQPGNSYEQEADRVANAVMQRAANESQARNQTQQGFNFSQVRVHADARATKAAQSVRALAYTVGHHIVFRDGQYAPHTSTGRQLLAHELTHVVQQGQAQLAPKIQRTDWGPLGGSCCNEQAGTEWALVGDGTWQALAPDECTGSFTDCDGMTCGGGFYYVSNLAGGICRTPRNDDATYRERRWTPKVARSDARSPTYRGSTQGDTPPGYTYDES